METLVTAIITTYPDIPPRAMCPWPGIAPSLPAITKKIFISDTEQDQRHDDQQAAYQEQLCVLLATILLRTRKLLWVTKK